MEMKEGANKPLEILFDTAECFVISMLSLPADKRGDVYNDIVSFVSTCEDMADRMKRPVAIIKENLERLLYSCRCLAGLEEDGYPDTWRITWALGAIENLRSVHAFNVARGITLKEWVAKQIKKPEFKKAWDEFTATFRNEVGTTK